MWRQSRDGSYTKEPGEPQAVRDEKAFSPRCFQDSQFLPTSWFQSHKLQDYEKIDFCCVMPRSLWDFVTATLED